MREWGIRSFGLTRRFGPVTAVAGVSLKVPYGEVCALAGPPGAGKSTLLRLLATALRAHAGSFCVAGHRVSTWPPHRPQVLAIRRRIGYFPAEPGHFLDLTPVESTWLFARARGLPAAGLRDEIRRWLTWAEVEDGAHRSLRAMDYSHRRRVALVQALIHHPPVLLLDDPGRDQPPTFRVRLAAYLRQAAAAGAAVLIAVDLPDGAPPPPEVVAADRTLRMAGGHLGCGS